MANLKPPHKDLQTFLSDQSAQFPRAPPNWLMGRVLALLNGI